MMSNSAPQRPLPQRPQALQMPNDVMEAMASARASSGQGVAAAAPALNLSALQSLAALGSLNRSAFAPVGPMLPEVGLWSQLNQMLVAGAAQQPGAGELIAYQANLAAQQGAAARGNGRSRSGDGSKSSSAYANRHQQAEQRRRTRINERLDALRAITPHSERSNTATFLEECRTYVEGLQKRVAELELELAAARGIAQTAIAALQPAPQCSAAPPAAAGQPASLPEQAPVARAHAPAQELTQARGQHAAHGSPGTPCGACGAARPEPPAQGHAQAAGQPGTPPAVSGTGSGGEAAGAVAGASPDTSSEDSGVPLKKRRVQ